MTALGGYVDRYVVLRRALGYQPDNDAQLLAAFVRYLDGNGQTTLTVAAALAWADQATADQQTARRLQAVRGFARYLTGFEPDTQVPPAGLIAAADVRRTPHIFTEEQTSALINTASSLPPPVWGLAMATVIGLMAATGLLPGEIYRLGCDHVDLDGSHLAVMHSKHGKSRQIPLHATTVDALGRYARPRVRSFTDPAGSGFFLTASGSDLTSEVAARCFRRLVRSAGIDPAGGGRSPARLGDLRHSFAVHTLLSWHHAGVDAQRQLPVLSAFLGHNEPKGSQTVFARHGSPGVVFVGARRPGGAASVPVARSPVALSERVRGRLDRGGYVGGSRLAIR